MPADVLNSLQFIQDYGVNLVCVEDGDRFLFKDSGKLTITVLSAVAENLKGRILLVQEQWKEESRRPERGNGMAGRLLFGYDLDSRNSTLVVNEEESGDCADCA